MRQVVEATARPNTRLIWVELFVLLNMWDALTTQIGIAVGVPEGNPIPAGILQTGGPLALIASKLVITLLVAGTVLLLPHRRRLIYGLYVSVPLLALVVVNNLAQILA